MTIWMLFCSTQLSYLSQPAFWRVDRNCTATVPKILHVSDAQRLSAAASAGLAAMAPGYLVRDVDDIGARRTLATHCGKQYAIAFDCLLPGAFRADLYRMCALHAFGGVYMDADLRLLKPLDEIIEPCANVTLSYDSMLNHLGTRAFQIAFMSAKPGHPIFKCHLDAIVRHVSSRYISKIDATEISGPPILYNCFAEGKFSDISIGYIDVRRGILNRAFVNSGAEDTGLVFARAGSYDQTLGFRASDALIGRKEGSKDKEQGLVTRRNTSHYMTRFLRGEIYSRNCPLRRRS